MRVIVLPSDIHFPYDIDKIICQFSKLPNDYRCNPRGGAVFVQPRRSLRHCIGLSRVTFRIQKVLVVEFSNTKLILALATGSILEKMASVL